MHKALATVHHSKVAENRKVQSARAAHLECRIRLRKEQARVMGYPRPGGAGVLGQILYDMEALHKRRSYQPYPEEGPMEYVCSALPYTWV